MKTLDEIAISHGTDKATQFTRTYAKPHGYTLHMARVFDPIRANKIKLLEIGVGGGESIRTWLEYFPKAIVLGVDKNHTTNEWNTPDIVHDRYRFIQGDQSCNVFWACFLADHGKDWNIIIDDGSHIGSDIITTFGCLWPNVAPGGFYLIEDLATAYGASPNHVDWLLDKVDHLNTLPSDIDSISFSKELAILQKRSC